MLDEKRIPEVQFNNLKLSLNQAAGLCLLRERQARDIEEYLAFYRPELEKIRVLAEACIVSGYEKEQLIQQLRDWLPSQDKGMVRYLDDFITNLFFTESMGPADS